jgi:hypothetical protein
MSQAGCDVGGAGEVLRRGGHDGSSIPIRRSPVSGSRAAIASAATRATIVPTVRQAIRSNAHSVVLAVATASQATVSSNAAVCPALCRARGTCTTVGPCCGQATRGASASSQTCRTPASR